MKYSKPTHRCRSFTIFILASVITVLAVPLSSYGVSLWSSSAVPATASFADNNAYEIGVKFTSDVSGYVTGIRFYKGSGNTGTHVGHLWTSTGTLLASATFTNETASGWQQVSFAQPVLISANTVYVASYWDPKGNYALNRPYFTSEYNNAPLHALADSTAAPNGVYLWNSSAFPNSGYEASNYWVDVVFVPATQVSLWSASSVPATASFSDNNPYEIGVKFTSDVSGYVTGIRFYKGSGNTGTHVGHLWTNTGTLLASATFTNETASGWQQVSFAPPVLISANTDYVASYWDPKGNYALNRPYFTTEYNNAPLHAVVDGAAGSNGAYLWNSSAFPSSGYDASNYWVDVAFSPLPAATTTTSASSATISSISPTSGPVSGGTLVTVDGSGFESGATVSFGGANASSVAVISSTELTAVTPAGSAGAVNVTATDPSSGDGSLADGFMYISDPTVSGVSPDSGLTTGGTTVTISGSGFQSGVMVVFGAILAASVTVMSPTQIQAVTPAESAGSVGITITNPDAGTASLASAFNFVAPTSSISSLLTGPLLTGMTPSNYTVPSGWTLVDANNFSSGYHAGEGATSSSNATTIDCSLGHADSCSLDTHITHSFAGYGMMLNGNDINSREVYVSYWMYVSNSNPGYGFDYTNWYHLVRVPQGQTVGYGIDFDFLPSSPPSCWYACVGGSAALFGNISGYGWGAYKTWFNQTPGQWMQFEFHVKANDPGKTDGELEYYVNGVLMGQCAAANGCPSNGGATPGNLVQSTDYTTANLYVGGDWGADMWCGNAACTTYSSGGDLGYGSVNANMAACQDAIMCPPKGAIPYFDIYITDVIILKR